MASLFTSKVKSALSAVLSVSVALTSTLPAAVNAQSYTCTASTADAGTDPKCAAVRIGGVPVAYPKLQWEKISDVALTTSPGPNAMPLGGSESVALANRTALALGVSASDVVNANTMFPANVPYVFGRFNPLNGTLRIDVFKLEKGTVGTDVKAGLYHATFTPAHGDHWKASRSYIAPDAYKAGVTPGVNPFASFAKPGEDIFQNISFGGAQVAVGHAMRMAGAPLGMLSVADSRVSTKTKKGGGLFTKKIETWVLGHTKSKWFIAQPTEVLSRSTTLGSASFCAQDPTLESCPMYQTAVSGVSFEEFEGGTLNAQEDEFTLDYQKKSGLSFLGALVLGVVGSFALAGILGAAGITAGAAGGATAGGGASAMTMGTFGNFLVSQGAISGFSSVAGAIAVEALYVSASMAVMAGANLSSVIQAKPAALLGIVKVSKGAADNPTLDKYHTKLNAELVPRTETPLSTATIGSNQMLTSFSKTVMGDCSVDSKLADCSSESGMIPKVDQFQEQNRVEFIKDSGGSVIRDANSGATIPLTPVPD